MADACRREEINMEHSVESAAELSTLAVPKHILVATDLADSEDLIPHVISQAKANGAQVTIVHAMPFDFGPIAGKAIPEAENARIERDVRLMMTGIMRALESQGITCDFVFRQGHPADVIREELARTGADRLIMATHGRGKLGQLALGSVAKELLTNADVPVFIVGPLSHTDTVHFTPTRILHLVSLNGDDQERVCFAFDVAKHYGAELTLLHVLDPDVKDVMNPDRTFKWAENALAALVTHTSELTPRARIRIEAGNTVNEVVRVSSEEKTDWIVLGVDGRFPSTRFQNSTAYKVLASAPCPILTLRHEQVKREKKVRMPERISLIVG
jgi:nucleotide-binding universal stress UspA family protein